MNSSGTKSSRSMTLVLCPCVTRSNHITGLRRRRLGRGCLCHCAARCGLHAILVQEAFQQPASHRHRNGEAELDSWFAQCADKRPKLVGVERLCLSSTECANEMVLFITPSVDILLCSKTISITDRNHWQALTAEMSRYC